MINRTYKFKFHLWDMKLLKFLAHDCRTTTLYGCNDNDSYKVRIFKVIIGNSERIKDNYYRSTITDKNIYDFNYSSIPVKMSRYKTKKAIHALIKDDMVKPADDQTKRNIKINHRKRVLK